MSRLCKDLKLIKHLNKPEIKNFERTHPHLAEEWHPSKNGTLTPRDVTSKSKERIWWKCPEGPDHEWEATVNSRTSLGTGCPCCFGRNVSVTNSLLSVYPQIAREFHPTKNGAITADQVHSGSNKKYWWKCPEGPDHEWEAAVASRTGLGTGCPCCSGRNVSVTNSLLSVYPQIAREFHPTKNGATTADQVPSGSSKKYWWKCLEGPDHEWVTAVHKRTSGGQGCPCCAGLKISTTNSLLSVYPEIALEFHPTKNGNITADQVLGGSDKKYWWKCPKDVDHEWEASVGNRTKKKGTGCPCCSGQKLSKSNSLTTRYPEIAREFHPIKNGNITADQVLAGSHKKYWWKCSKGPDHEWEATVISRTSLGTGCPCCFGRNVSVTNSLLSVYPQIALEFHPTKNGTITADQVPSGSNKKYWWKCSNGVDHEWETSVINRTKQKGTGCPYCCNQKVTLINSLTIRYPEIALEFHPTKNGNITADQVVGGSGKKYWWKCSKDPDHVWESRVADRTLSGTGCPYCNCSWTVEKIRLFVKDILPHLECLTPAELYVIFQQNGILNYRGKNKAFIQALKTGKFPKEELEKFIQCEKSLVDDFIENPDERIDQSESIVAIISEEDISNTTGELPLVETKDVLAFLSDKIISNIDAEAIEFFINSAVAKIWNHAFIDEKTALHQLSECTSDIYSEKIKSRFLEQYEGAKNLPIPFGYSFKVNGKLSPPNLMQRFTAFMLKTRKRLGNWSGTGAGKTLSAILSSRVIDARFTIICCPNNVIQGWKHNIETIYPDSVIFIKDTRVTLSPNRHSYLILNYEFFQQPQSESKLNALVGNQKIDFVVIDEIHYSKQRVVDDISKRKQIISALLSEAAKKNDNLHVLGMSATPVINNLFEGKTLIELITGVLHDDLNTKPSVGNCISLYQKLVSTGIRWLPRYHQKIDVKTVDVDCGSYLDKIKNVSLQGSMANLEAVLTTAKIPIILENLKPKTIVYTHYLKDILIPLKEAIELQGWKTAIFTGDDKSGLEEFIKFDANVLIASSCLGTGVDGLQHVCNRIIINTLPWTHAEFEQLKGRVYRQGQKSDHVDIIVPLTYANINGEQWSWCDSRWKRILFKKSIADAAVDGVIPEGHLRTPAQAYQDTMNWLKRLEEGKLHEIERHKINLQLSETAHQQGLRKFGDFSKMNQQLNSSSSATTHKKFLQHPEDWEYYHSLYREARKEWTIVPYEEAAKWCKARPHLVVGDFGCGEALLAQEIENKVYSFDHIAVNEDVTSCDIAHVPIDDEFLDAAIFSLSLMGTNYLDYLKEAHRCLKLDGHLWIAETTSRYQNLSSLEEELSKIGFDPVSKQEKGSFTFLRLIKSDRETSSVQIPR
jgi:hypothetical protein